jgi:hypothetical protein
VIVPGSTHEWQRNMLKAILSPLQVNAQGVNIIKDRQNNLPEANSTNAVFRTMEVSTDTVSCNTPALRSGISTHLLTNVTHKAETAHYLQLLGFGLKDKIWICFPTQVTDFSLFQSVRTCSVFPPSLISRDTGNSLLDSKVDGP